MGCSSSTPARTPAQGLAAQGLESQGLGVHAAPLSQHTPAELLHGLRLHIAELSKREKTSLDIKKLRHVVDRAVSLLNHLDDDGMNDDPVSVKAFVKLSTGKEGPLLKSNNALRMIFTSCGLTRNSSEAALDFYKRLYTEGRPSKRSGLVYLVDARKLTKPCKNARQLRDEGEMGGGSLEVLMKDADDGAPIFNCYLSGGDSLGADGKPEYKIMVGEGVWQGGKFIPKKTDGSFYPASGPKSDFDEPEKGCWDTCTEFFKAVTDKEFEALLQSVRTVYACGGVTWCVVHALQPNFVDDGVELTNCPNPYSRSLLDMVKTGQVVYVGASAGTVAMSYALGPLTTDAMIHKDEDDDHIDFGPRGELGLKWLYPGLGEYLGIPHNLVLKPHITFDTAQGSYQGRDAATAKLANALIGLKHDAYCCLLVDNDFDKQQGECLAIYQGRVSFCVAKCDVSDPLSAEVREELNGFAWPFHGERLRRQPPAVPVEGFAFEWEPSLGDIIAAGPRRSKCVAHPFRVFASSSGALPDAPLY